MGRTQDKRKERLRYIGARIRHHASRRGYSHARLAVASGIPLSTLATYLADDPAEIGAVNLAGLALALGCTVDELVLDANEQVATTKVEVAS